MHRTCHFISCGSLLLLLVAQTVERRSGRAELIAGMADPRHLLASYNATALESNAAGGEQLATWSPRLLEMILAQ